MAVPVPERRIAEFEGFGFGMFIHWGLYSLLGEGEWILHRQGMPLEQYAKLKDRFAAEKFDAGRIARLARRAGMKYCVITTRHHEGFSLYDTRGLSDFDAPHSAAGRDLIAEFVEGCRKNDIVPFFYHTTLDWYQKSFNDDFDAYLDYLKDSVEVLCRNYGRIGGLWFDGNWSRKDADWKLDELYGMIRRYQPEAMIINNTGLQARGQVVHPEIDSVTFEQGRPEPMDREGRPKYLAAEMCQTMNDHWGVGRADLNYKATGRFIENLCACRKVGANYLLNIGPNGDGSIPMMEAAILETMGVWMDCNGEAVYQGRPAAVRGDGENFALQADSGKLFLFVFNLKVSGDANVTVDSGGVGEKRFTGVDGKVARVNWTDNGEELDFQQDLGSRALAIDATGYPYGVNLAVRVAEVWFD